MLGHLHQNWQETVAGRGRRNAIREGRKEVQRDVLSAGRNLERGGVESGEYW